MPNAATTGTYVELPLDPAYVTSFAGGAARLRLAVTMPALLGTTSTSWATFRAATHTSAPFLVLSSACA